MPAASACSTFAAGKVFVTAMSVTASRVRPARVQAAAMRASTAVTFARISSARDTVALQQSSVRAIDGEVRQAIRVFVARAEGMANGKARELPHQRLRLRVHGNQVGMLDAVDAEHLFHEQLGIRNDLDLASALGIRDFQGLEESR